jgi:PilZ domain-containing protein
MYEIIRSKGKSAKRVVSTRPAAPGEIGRPYRYKVPLCVEARPKGGKPVSNYAFFPTKDVSATGFYFLSDAPFPEKSRIEFVISMPRKTAGGTVELLRGVGKCVRVEHVHDGNAVRYGIGVHIEKSQGKLERSLKPPIRR